MTQHSGSAVALSSETIKPASSSGKRAMQMAGAVALSMGMVGTFGLPAYAVTPENAAEQLGAPEQSAEAAAQAQALLTAQADPEVAVAVDVEADVSSDVIAAEKAEAEAQKAEAEAQKAEEEAAAAAEGDSSATTSTTSSTGSDVKPGKGAEGIVAAAYAQLGDFQDCTALVERSLRAVGIPAGDLGTQIGEYTALGGTLVTSGDYAPGDVLIWSGRHVAVYVGNGQAVHGGYGGNQTVVAGAFIDGTPSGVVRFG